MAVAAAVRTRPPGAGITSAGLRPLLARTNRHGLAFLAVHAGLLALTGAALWLTLGTWWAIPAVVVYGVALAHLFALLHECTHRTAFRWQPANRALAAATGFVVGVPPRYFRLEHTAHHRYTQDDGRDPELIRVPPTIGRYVLFVAGGPYWWWAGRTLVAHAAGRILPFETTFVPPAERRRIMREARWFLAVYAVAIAGSVAAGSPVVPWLWLVPRLVGEPAMRIARLSEHAGRPLDADPMDNTRSLRVPAPLRVLAWNMPYHAEHHAAPSVPFHALPRLHTALAPQLHDAGGGYLAAQADILRQVRAS